MVAITGRELYNAKGYKWTWEEQSDSIHLRYNEFAELANKAFAEKQSKTAIHIHNNTVDESGNPIQICLFEGKLTETNVVTTHLHYEDECTECSFGYCHQPNISVTKAQDNEAIYVTIENLIEPGATPKVDALDLPPHGNIHLSVEDSARHKELYNVIPASAQNENYDKGK